MPSAPGTVRSRQAMDILGVGPSGAASARLPTVARPRCARLVAHQRSRLASESHHASSTYSRSSDSRCKTGQCRGRQGVPEGWTRPENPIPHAEPPLTARRRGVAGSLVAGLERSRRVASWSRAAPGGGCDSPVQDSSSHKGACFGLAFADGASVEDDLGARARHRPLRDADPSWQEASAVVPRGAQSPYAKDIATGLSANIVPS